MSSSQPALILIVDDQAQNLHILTAVLHQAGYRLAAANSAQVALRILERRRPNLILCDITMPEMSGFDLCATLKDRAETRHIPFVFLSGKSEHEEITHALELGAVDYILKPFHVGELLNRVDHHLRLSKLSAQQDALRMRMSQEFQPALQELLQESQRHEALKNTRLGEKIQQLCMLNAEILADF